MRWHFQHLRDHVYHSSLFTIIDSGDTSKKLVFDISAVITATTRKILMPDSDVNLGDIIPKGAPFNASEVVKTNGVGALITQAIKSAFNKAFGAIAGTVTEGNDSRLSDSRTPTGPAGGRFEW